MQTSGIAHGTDTQPGFSRRAFVARAAAIGAGAFLSSGQGRRSAAVAAEAAAKPSLIVHTESPMNAEPPLDDLIRSWITPVKSFYIRSHAPNPQIDPAGFHLTIEGLVNRPLSIPLTELMQPTDPVSVVATLTCAGNRRYEHSRIRPVSGVPWREGAIGNAKWTGIRLSDLLKRAGVQEQAKHVWFEGLDQIPHGDAPITFGASIPLTQAMNDLPGIPGALVTTHMNDEPLTEDHGAPLRTIVPGYIGARSVKWLGKIVVSNRPSPNHYVADAYKLVEDGDQLELDEQSPIYRFPLNSVICNPSVDQALPAGMVNVAGYALPPGRPGTGISRIEVSADAGRTWTVAKVTSPVRDLCWQLWAANVAVSSSTSELIVRATDSRDHQQPQQGRWNLKGYLFDAWHHVPVKVG